MLLEHPGSDHIGMLWLTVAGPWHSALLCASLLITATAILQGNSAPQPKSLKGVLALCGILMPFVGVGIRRGSNGATQHQPVGIAQERPHRPQQQQPPLLGPKLRAPTCFTTTAHPLVPSRSARPRATRFPPPLTPPGPRDGQFCETLAEGLA